MVLSWFTFSFSFSFFCFIFQVIKLPFLGLEGLGRLREGGREVGRGGKVRKSYFMWHVMDGGGPMRITMAVCVIRDLCT